MDPSQVTGSQARSSSGSVRPSGSRSTNPDKQISQIEKSVTHLLVATKQLLETLTQWSRGNSQEEEVSDVYVRLGYEFNLACRAFNSIGVETSDLGPVPDLLRSILEDTLSQPASPQALDNYLPRIRDIIINLLHGLKRKQSKLRSRPPKDGQGKPAGAPPGAPPRQSSITSIQSNETEIKSALDSAASTANAVRSDSRMGTLKYSEQPRSGTGEASPNSNLSRSSISRQSQRGQSSRQVPAQESAISTSTSQSQDVPTVIPTPIQTDHSLPTVDTTFAHAPPLPPKQDPFTALQRGPDLERRASRRFSAYQIQKHLGASPSGVPVIPPAQNSPIPNRGREARESLTAVRSRTSFQTIRQRSNNRLQEISPSRSDSAKVPQRISEERDEPPQLAVPQIDPPDEAVATDSPTAKTPDEYVSHRTSQPVVGATINGPLPSPEEYRTRNDSVDDSENETLMENDALKTNAVGTEQRATATPPPTQTSIDLDSSLNQGKELTLFLQYKSKIKKFVLNEGYEGLSMGRLQLAFIEKFAWNTHNNGIDLPEIYVQDPVSGVRHELEDLSDVKDRSVLVLNVEVLDEVKKHFDDNIGGLKTTLESVRLLLDDQGSLMQRFSDRQLQTSKDMARLSATPAARPTRALQAETTSTGSSAPSEASLNELQNLRRDIAVLRQTYSTMSSDFAATMTEIKAKAAVVKESAAVVVTPSIEGGAGREHVNEGKRTLAHDSAALVNRVDNLQDVVEDLRKDVVTRGVRPLPRQLEELSKEITTTTRQLTKIKDFLKREKPVWTKVWEHELTQVCTEREDLTQQEELMADLDVDLEDVTGIFKLVEEAMKQQTQTTGPGGLRNPSKQLEFDTSVDPQTAKDGVLDEVRALKPNHESRLEAIDRAEKARQKELENRQGDEFQREVKDFVEEGRLKKTGGMDEVERLRKIKDERAIKENFERQQAREAERARKRQEEAAAKVAAEAAAKESTKQNPDENLEPNGTTIQSDLEEPTISDAQSLSFVENDGSSPKANENMNGDASTQSEAGRLSPQQLRDALIDESDDHDRDSGPPQLPEVNINGDEGGNHKSENAENDQQSGTNSNSRSSWWKPAVFAST